MVEIKRMFRINTPPPQMYRETILKRHRKVVEYSSMLRNYAVSRLFFRVILYDQKKITS
jgi:hypothetical protein